MLSNNRNQAHKQTEARNLRMSVGSHVAIYAIISTVLVLLIATNNFSANVPKQLTTLTSTLPAPEDVCSRTSNGSDKLREYITGRIDYSDISDDGIPVSVSLRPRTSIPLARDSTKSEGTESEDELILELRDSDGHSLKSINFYVQPSVWHIDPTLEALEENPDMITILKNANFYIFIANPPNYASMAILYEGSELEIEEHSANTPCISVVWQPEGQTFSDEDNIVLSMKTTDADGEEFIHSIFYSIDGRFYRLLSSAKINHANARCSADLWNRSWCKPIYSFSESSVASTAMIPVASLRSSPYVRLAVLVTDGKRSVITEGPTFIVTERPEPLNQPPVAVDDAAENSIDEILQIDVLANDIDTEGDFATSSLTIDEPPVLGTAELDGESVTRWVRGQPAKVWRPLIVYTPGSTGVDTLVYTICDSEGLCDSARVTIASGVADCTILGTEDDETLLGTPNDDVICGLGGNDTIQAGGGNDIIMAGSGDDLVFAGAGDDIIFGETGSDTIDAGAGDDLARGGDGNDYIKGGNGADRLYGEFGKNILVGGPGNDSIYGGKGNDNIWGGYGNDLIYGGIGNDTIRGGGGDDIIRDSRGHDIIYPGQGDNTVTGTNSEDAIIEDSLSCLRLGKYSYQTAKPLLIILFC